MFLQIGKVYVFDAGQRLLQLLILGGFDAELHDVVVKFFFSSCLGCLAS